MKHRYLKNVATLRLSAEKCIGCGRCTEVCPHGVFSVNENKAKIKDKDRCMECGACSKNCPTNAIAVDSGVGCAAAVIIGWLKGSEPSCDCSDSEGCC
ncbi:mercury methylation ferredoxin HgcB [Acetivibrio mesophilus]|uniref:4Fe-4S dicluster domain-containing protein n=1 Tax=Acetivibrio mesophilus TaxID=2487273 RepID=A0A4Q0I968_9FIRM|nr:mercury methylation ferredoxin HgcB [Acetivibrio mesophilus]ODM26423.1 ferredoxin [Clostridium sp. Bc-iso-3]RXE60515.1 4Fe-4S dicluster domain-containing protein [Acetivibrio mesophilus]